MTSNDEMPFGIALGRSAPLCAPSVGRHGGLPLPMDFHLWEIGN